MLVDSFRFQKPTNAKPETVTTHGGGQNLGRQIFGKTKTFRTLDIQTRRQNDPRLKKYLDLDKQSTDDN